MTLNHLEDNRENDHTVINTDHHPACHVIHYTIDGEPEQTVQHKMTPRQILVEAGINPEHYYLVEIKGHSQHSYEDSPDKPIPMHEGATFVSVYRCATPVS